MGNSFTKHKEDEVQDVRVDEGQVVPFKDGVYPNGPNDWDVQVVKRLILERRMAPFYKGLGDYDEAANMTSCPTPTSTAPSGSSSHRASVVPESLAALSREGLSWSPRRHSHDRQSSVSSTFSLRGKRSVSMPSQLAQQGSLSRIQPDELYKYPTECPICFLYYPANINYSRCCDQPICTECFVQIKRPEATLEPAACPFCVEPNFGILYHPPGSLEYKAKLVAAHSETMEKPAVERSKSAGTILAGAGDDDEKKETLAVPSAAKSKRRASVSHTSTMVVTSDELRPDWLRKQQQLALVRAANQRRMSHPIGEGSRRSRLYLNPDRDLSDAAAAAAALVESMTGSSGSASNRSHRMSRVNRTGERRRQPRQGGDLSLGYLEAMRSMGADLEELMVMEAIRRSLAESEAANRENGNADEGTANASGNNDPTLEGNSSPSSCPTSSPAAQPPPASSTPSNEGGTASNGVGSSDARVVTAEAKNESAGRDGNAEEAVTSQ